MNFLKSKRDPEEATDYRVVARLNAIAVRGRNESCAYPAAVESAEERPPKVQRRFWSPHELADHT